MRDVIINRVYIMVMRPMEGACLAPLNADCAPKLAVIKPKLRTTQFKLIERPFDLFQ